MSVTKPENAAESGFRSEFFEDLFEMEARSFWFRARNHLIVWALKKYFPESRSFLEIGCGTGFVLTGIAAACPDLELAGSELFEEGLEFARRRLPATALFELDARNLPFTQAYDVIGAFDVIEHIEEDQIVLQEIQRASKQGVVITVPQHPFLWSGVDELACHKRRYSAEELRRKVTQAGFSVIRMTSFVSILLPFMLVSRCTKRKAEQVGKSEFELPALIDWVLELTIKAEQLLIQCGLNFPFGGSLLLVAVKADANDCHERPLKVL